MKLSPVTVACLLTNLVKAFQPRARFVSKTRSSLYRGPETFLYMSSPSIVVVSPPGGVGEVAAVKSAELGCNVRWFVVSPPAAENANEQQKTVATLKLSPQAINMLQAAGGTLELAGSEADKLLLPTDQPESTLAAVAQWTGTADALICTYDTGSKLSERSSKNERELQRQQTWKDAIKVAACEAAQIVSQKGNSVAILSAFDEEDPDKEKDSESITGLITGILSGGKPRIPNTLTDAVSGSGQTKVYRLRHGNLFGLPESSPNFSPLMGGPRKDAELCEEYSMRAARVDPTLSISGNIMLGSSTRSSRLAVGEAAVLMALGKVPVSSDMDLCISSQIGMEPMTLEQWREEFERAQQVLTSGQAARLFSADFASIPNKSRLADWLATKWAPAVLRTYDIATIRSGERPVFVNRVDENNIEIVWQQLVDFQTATVGKMLIEVTDDGIVALRGAGDPLQGFGSVSPRPLNGEDVFVRFLAEAASQAVDKGLAKRAKPKTVTSTVKAVEKVPVTSLQSAGTIVVDSPEPMVSSSEQLPRTAGVRRSKERQRGKRQRKEGDQSP